VIHQWSIIDGPGTLTEGHIGQPTTFSIGLADGSRAAVTVHLETVGRLFGGAVKSFSGVMHVGTRTYEVIGTYNVRDRSGTCQTTAHE
jgi:hypothetical protein